MKNNMSDLRESTHFCAELNTTSKAESVSGALARGAAGRGSPAGHRPPILHL